MTELDRKWWKQYQPLTEGERLEQAIDLANTGSARAYLLLTQGVSLSEPMLTSVADSMAPAIGPLCKQEQAYLQDVLPRIVALWADKRAGIDESMRDLWFEHMEGMVFVPTVGPNDTGPPAQREDLPRLRARVVKTFPNPPMAPVAYVLVRLLARPSDLCCCQWCKKLFPVGRPDTDRKGTNKGRDIRLYCSPEHRAAAEREQAKERASKYRANVRASAKQSRKHK